MADLLSNPVRTGYLTGLAVVILIGQLPKLFGFSTDADGLIEECVAFLQGVADGLTNPWSLAIGLLSLAIIVGLRRFSPRTPGILIAVVLSIVLSIVLDLASHGVDVIGPLPEGFPMPSFPAVDLGGHGHPLRLRDRHLAGGDGGHHLDLRRLRETGRL